MIDQYENDVGMAYGIARVYGFLGEMDTALEWFGKALDRKEWPATWITVDPLAEPLRRDSRAAEFIAALDLPDR